MCVKGLSMWEKGTHKAEGIKKHKQVTDVGIEGSTPDMLVRVLSLAAPLDFTESSRQTVAGLQAPNLSLVFS